VMQAEYARHKKTQATKLLEHHKETGSALLPEMIEALMKHTELEGEGFKIEQLARSVGMSIAYDTLYRGTSGYAAHPTLGALQQLIGSGEDWSIIFGGDLSSLRHSLINMVIPMVDLFQPLSDIFHLGLGFEGVAWAAELGAISDADWKAKTAQS
jgi:hypothetical protein